MEAENNVNSHITHFLMQEKEEGNSHLEAYYVTSGQMLHTIQSLSQPWRKLFYSLLGYFQ